MSARRWKNRGIAALEFGLWLPVLMIAFGGVVDLTFWMITQSAITRASRDGCRYGAAFTKLTTNDGTATEDDFNALADDTEVYATDVLNAIMFGIGSETTCAELAGCSVEASWEHDVVQDLVFLTVEVNYPYDSVVGQIPGLEDGVTSRFTMVTQLQFVDP